MSYCLGDAHDLSNLWLALAFMPFGLFFDFMDGKVARWRGKSSLMGQELDSLADLCSSPSAPRPAASAFAVGMRTSLDRLCLTFFVVCGLLRLARFNVTVSSLPKDATGKSKYFEGTPIPTSLSIAALIGVLGVEGLVWRGYTGRTIGVGVLEVHPAVGLFVAHACLMISKTLKIPKP
ncbi:hypothetical protein MRB53_039381 [Persea americana]|nr:hypothetical protein MRB53_039381 [Persea americana]